MKNTKNLVNEVLNGNTNAFEELYQLTSGKVYFTCLSFVKNEQDALDLMQETYLSALTHLSALKEPDRFPQWVSSIATNKCRDYLGKKSPLLLDEEVLDTLPSNEDDLTLPEHYITERAKRKILMDIMGEQLSMVQYQTILLYYFDGLSQQEIAKCMECPEGTVSYRLSVARNKIKEGVLSYEKKSGDKLYCVAGVPFLAAFFLAQAEEIIVPDVLSNILGAFTSNGAAAAEGVVQTASDSASQTAAKVTAEAAKQTAKKAGATAFTKSAVFKIGLGIAAISLLGTMVATVFLFTSAINKYLISGESKLAESGSSDLVSSDLGSSENTGDVESFETENTENTNEDSTYVYDGETIAIEYISSSYVDNPYYENGDILLKLNIVNKTDTELGIAHFFGNVYGMSIGVGANRAETRLYPGENEYEFNIPLYELMDNGPIEISSSDYVLITEHANGNTGEKAQFTVNYDTPIAFNAVPHFPYEECELIFENEYLSYYSTCEYNSQVSGDEVRGYLVYHHSEIMRCQTATVDEDLNHYITCSGCICFPDTYTTTRAAFWPDYDETKEQSEIMVVFDLCDIMNSNSWVGEYTYHSGIVKQTAINTNTEQSQ